MAYGEVTRGAMGGRPQGSPLRRGYKGCGKAGRRGRRPLRKRYKGCNGRATARVAPTKALQEVQWAGDRKGRPYEIVTRGAAKRADVGIGPYGGDGMY